MIRGLGFVILLISGCDSTEARVADSREPQPIGVETFSVSKTTDAIFKTEGLLELQRKLNAGGSEPMKLTGTLTEETQRALGAWQKANGLPETGLPDYVSLKKLGIDAKDVFHPFPGK